MTSRPPRRGRRPGAAGAANPAGNAGNAGSAGHAGDTAEPRRAGAAAAPADPAAAARQPIRLPASGLARDILAAVEQQQRQPAAAAPLAGVAPPVPSGPNRIFSFAESLERREAKAPEAPPERPESWVAFELAGERYALPVSRIQEIQRAHGITRVPHAPQPVRGIASLRGKVLVVVDLRLRLGLPPAAVDERSRILVVAARERSLGLLVDAAHQVLALLPSRIEPPPPELMDERSAYLAGVVQLDDSLVIALDIDQLLLVPEDSETQSQPEAGGPP